MSKANSIEISVPFNREALKDGVRAHEYDADALKLHFERFEILFKSIYSSKLVENLQDGGWFDHTSLTEYAFWEAKTVLEQELNALANDF